MVREDSHNHIQCSHVENDHAPYGTPAVTVVSVWLGGPHLSAVSRERSLTTVVSPVLVSQNGSGRRGCPLDLNRELDRCSADQCRRHSLNRCTTQTLHSGPKGRVCCGWDNVFLIQDRATEGLGRIPTRYPRLLKLLTF